MARFEAHDVIFKETTETANCTDTSAIPKRRPSHAFINMTGSDARSSFGYLFPNPMLFWLESLKLETIERNWNFLKLENFSSIFRSWKVKIYFKATITFLRWFIEKGIVTKRKCITKGLS